MHHRLLRAALLALGLSALLTLGAAAYDGAAVVTSDSLSLHAAPDAGSEVLIEVKKDELLLTVAPVENAAGWYEADFGTWQGYVLTEGVVLLDGWDGELGYGKVKTDGSALNMRSGPGTDHARLTSVPYGTKLTLQAMEEGWFKTEYNGQTGYVCGDYIIAVLEDGSRADTPAATQRGLELVEYAKTFLGVPYVYGGSSPSGFDCSGLTWYVCKHFGISIARGASSQMRGLSNEIPLEQIQPGDLVFFRRAGTNCLASHVGIYVGDGMYIHAPQTGENVKIVPLVSTANRPIVGVRRVV